MKHISEKVFGSTKKKLGSVPVYLNVYDLTSFNGYAYWLGLGVYHSGVQVHGVEYAFGAHDLPTTGIFEGEPKHCPGFTFRKSILIGRTDLTPKEVRGFMEKLSQDYTGNTYNLITKNCNHFCNDACIKLTGKSIPRWVNRLARLGLLCTCVLPVDLRDAKVRQKRSEEIVREGEKKKLRSRSSRFPSSSSCSSTSSSLSTCSIFRNNSDKRPRSHELPPPPSLPSMSLASPSTTPSQPSTTPQTTTPSQPSTTLQPTAVPRARPREFPPPPSLPYMNIASPSTTPPQPTPITC